jgi:hypothetical protein
MRELHRLARVQSSGRALSLSTWESHTGLVGRLRTNHNVNLVACAIYSACCFLKLQLSPHFGGGASPAFFSRAHSRSRVLFASTHTHTLSLPHTPAQTPANSMLRLRGENPLPELKQKHPVTGDTLYDVSDAASVVAWLAGENKQVCGYSSGYAKAQKQFERLIKWENIDDDEVRDAYIKGTSTCVCLCVCETLA